MKRKITRINCVQKSIFVCLLFFSLSCINEKKKWIISEDTGGYWDIYRMEKKTYKYPEYGYHFQANGKCIYYFYHYKSKAFNLGLKRYKFDFGDEIIPETWSMKNDSIINVMGFHYKIIYLTKNEMTIVNLLNNQDTIYLKLSAKK